MKISYLDLLNKLSIEIIPDLIKLELNCGERYYQAFYDGGEFNYYGLCDAHLEDEDFKYYLSDTLLESQMFEDNIEIIEEDKEIEKIKWNEKSQCQSFMSINKADEMLMSRSEQLKKSLNELIDEVNKLKRGDK